VQEDFRLILDLITVLAAAAAGGLFAALLRQPVLLGYLVAGAIVGPAGLGLIKEVVQVETLAQFGVAFLLFALGVEFSLSELKKVRAVSLGGGGLQIALTILGTMLVALAMGWVTSPAQGIFLGGILSLSSTAVVFKSLMERNEVGTPHGQVMMGILVVQDLALGLMLAVLPALHQPANQITWAVGKALLETGLFALAAIAAGIWLIPRLLRLLARTESRELFLLGIVVLCLGIALLAEQLHLSIAMGAFVAGLTIAEVEYADQTLTYVEPLRDIFATLFFVSVGMLIDPVFLWQHLELILGLVALVFVGKFLIITPLVKVFRYPWRTALLVGLGLTQIGEFSFVLASEGRAMGLVSQSVYLLILGTTALTLVFTPFILRLVPKLFDWVEMLPWLKQYLEQRDRPLDMAADLPNQNHIVVCGYGRVGRNIVRLLQDRHYPILVIDQSERAIQQLRDAGIPYVYGNASSLHVLEKAGVDQAKGLAIALPDPISTRLCLKRALELAPDLDAIVRAHQDKDIELLYQLGAWEVVQPEFEASLELATHLLLGMGQSLVNIQQDVQHIRSSHYMELRPQRAAGEISHALQVAAQDMNSQWYSLPEDSPLTGMTLEESDLRHLTGVSVLAIQRQGGGEVNYPDAQTALASRDRLLVVGEPEEFAAFRQLAQGNVAIPQGGKACQWLAIPAQSPIAGKMLSDLDLPQRYEIQVQAMRRDWKFIRFPDGETALQEGDRLLLCGNSNYLEQIQQLNTADREALPVLEIPNLEVNG